MKKSISPYSHCLYFSSNAFSRLMTKMSDEEFAPTGLSSSLAFVLITVNNQPGISPMEICRIMLLAPSTVTRFLDKMEQGHYLFREQHGKNIKVHPSQKGVDMMDELQSSWERLQIRYSTILGKESTANLTKYLTNATSKLI